MDTKAFEELKKSLHEGLRIIKGELEGEEASPEAIYGPEIDTKSIRAKLEMTQEDFALLLGVSVGTLRNWEQHHREPTGAAQRLLVIADKHPEILLKTIKA